MCSFLTFTAAFVAATSICNASSFERRATIPHDEVIGFPETVPSNLAGQLALKYKPYLYVANGCVPFPAVNAEGDVSGGLAPTGSPTGDCDSSSGQIYSRSTTYNNQYAIMYSWYFPKDSPASGLGHRHDWESIVIWLNTQSESAELLGVAASAHGDYETSTTPELDGNAPLIQYISYFPLDHQLDFTGTTGGQQPLIAWESLPQAAQQALTNTDWGDANVPFIDANFENNLAEASL